VKYLSTIFLFLSVGFFLTCTTDSVIDKDESTEIKAASELVYLNRLEEAEAILLQLDTSKLNDGERAELYLTNGFLQHGLGHRNLSLKYLSKASDLISDENDARLSAELNLINGFIFEQLILRSEASNAYFEAYEFFKNESFPDKSFYTLLGIARTSPGGVEYLKPAKELLEQLKSNRFQVIYMNAEAALMSDVRERNNTVIKSLNYFDEDYDLKKQIFLYSKIAMNYQLLDIPDSAFYYLALSQKIIDNERVNPQKILHFYNIKAYVESQNNMKERALETLDFLFNYASEEPGVLSQAYLRRSYLLEAKGNYEAANHDIRKHKRLADEERAKADRYQLGLLSIQYQLQHKELQLARVRYHLLLTIVLAFILLMVVGWIFLKWKRRAEKKKKELENKYAKTSKLLDEQVEESIKEAQLVNMGSENGKFNGQKLQEFGAVFRVHHPLFREKLMKIHPEISQNDQKHCEFVLGGLSVYQATQILGVSVEAVKKARKKLRSKFGCPTIKELHSYLQKIDESF
jgi:hypothetical protein